uniref:Uncharacterized protein n=1 Tax=Candidatus Kentrum sp. DK TaxID=2126562 RepID=A0A450T051_9GAMM|nr:MAG: hypothetical protein BECKDK2373B_GA0170837_105315 [Candidatus Kentron sp. DK]VFJ59685.1 MAG: hypothetical protein BECKDK2373C_GA0170839_10735 [Candidatus Kentron sp. DK]
MFLTVEYGTGAPISPLGPLPVWSLTLRKLIGGKTLYGEMTPLSSNWGMHFNVSRGRNARYRTSPAQTRMCDFSASGSSVVLVFAQV